MARSEIRNIRGDQEEKRNVTRKCEREEHDDDDGGVVLELFLVYNCFLSFFSLSLPLRCVPVLELDSVCYFFKGNGRCTHKSQPSLVDSTERL